MPSMNRTFLMGNLTREPEMKETQSGSVANFGLAVNEKYNDRNTGEVRESVLFIDVSAWGRQAEIAMEYLGKGDPVLVEGSLKYTSWDDDTGAKRSRVFVNAQRLQLLKSKADAEQNTAGTQGFTPQQTTPQQQNIRVDDDIPF